MSGEPDPKSRSLARGERRYRRKVASPKQWQRISAAKVGPCRVCVQPSGNGHGFNLVQFHHVVPRDLGGDDIEDNIVPLCRACHLLVTVLDRPTLAALAASLTNSEYAYVVGKLGESGPGAAVWCRAMTGQESLLDTRDRCPLCEGRREVESTPGQSGDGPMPCPRCQDSGSLIAVPCSTRRILGHVDKLGYLYCVDCYPVESSADLIWSDMPPHADEECELCHRPLNRRDDHG